MVVVISGADMTNPASAGSQYYWEDLAHVREFATQWMWQYNHERPNMGIDGMTPKQRLMAEA